MSEAGQGLWHYVERRTTKDGKIHYRVQVRLKGRPIQTATFDRKADAVASTARYLAALSHALTVTVKE